jgi:magnesium transporter
MDVVVDHYFTVLEGLGEQIEKVENEVITNPSTQTLRQIYRLKREVMGVRKLIWPVREVLNALYKSENDLLSDASHFYFRDVYDHTIQIMDAIEYDRDVLAGMLDIYLSSLSYRMNAIMKVLTIISTIFIPLTFLTSIYGMNFEHFPELKWPYAYYLLWCFMLSITAGMLFYFKKRRWF